MKSKLYKKRLESKKGDYLNELSKKIQRSLFMFMKWVLTMTLSLFMASQMCRNSLCPILNVQLEY